MHDSGKCNSAEHMVARRSFLGSLTAGAGAMAAGSALPWLSPAMAAQLQSNQKQFLLVYLTGGASQLETWDPKPGTDGGGPFAAIPTTVPGIHISELLPHTARQMHHLAVIRSLNTGNDDHVAACNLIQTGRPRDPQVAYPYIGPALAKHLRAPDNLLPAYVHLIYGHERINKSTNNREQGFLGPEFSPMMVKHSEPPANLLRPAGLTAAADLERQSFRRRLNERFLRGRNNSQTDAYAYSYEQAQQLMRQRNAFDIAQESEKDRDRYGRHDFGHNCLMARRLLEHGVSTVRISHGDYDTHAKNFNGHLEQLGEFDGPFATLISDLADRGMLENVLVVWMTDFGRSVAINANLGRNHWSKSWSMVLGGCGIQSGAVVGKTDKAGGEVVDREVHHGHLYHTYFRALGLDPTEEWIVGGRPIAKADKEAEAIKELLA